MVHSFFPQTQQGADIIASAMNATVYMPDMFEPHKPFPAEDFPPRTKETKAELQRFFKGPANAPVAIEKIVSFGKALREDGALRIGAYGFCWGMSSYVASSPPIARSAFVKVGK